VRREHPGRSIIIIIVVVMILFATIASGMRIDRFRSPNFHWARAVALGSGIRGDRSCPAHGDCPPDARSSVRLCRSRVGGAVRAAPDDARGRFA
jgi:hypothetical protein